MAQSRRILLCFCYIVGASVYTSIAIDMALDSAVIFRKTSSACTDSEVVQITGHAGVDPGSIVIAIGGVYARYTNGAFTADGDYN